MNECAKAPGTVLACAKQQADDPARVDVPDDDDVLHQCVHIVKVRIGGWRQHRP